MALHVEVNPKYGKDTSAGGLTYKMVDPNKVDSLLDTNCYKLSLYNLQQDGTPVITDYVPKDGKSSFDLMMEDLTRMYDAHLNKGSSRAKLLSEMAGQYLSGDPTQGNELAKKMGVTMQGIPVLPDTVRSLSKAPLVPSNQGEEAMSKFKAQSGDFDRARWWNNMVNGEEGEEQGKLTWREKLHNFHSSTISMIKDLCHKTHEKVKQNPFGPPIKRQLNITWQCLKEDFQGFKQNLKMRATY